MLKRTFSYLMFAFTIVLSFTSCETDDNEFIAQSLDGTWEGDMHISDAWSGIRYNYVRSRITFSKDPYRYATGTGYWVDYYDSRGRDYAADRFDWEVRERVRNGVRENVIYIHFWYHPSDIEIYGYGIDNGYFSGYMFDGYNDVYFRLYKTDWNQWNDYVYDDYWWSNETTFDNNKAE